MTANGDALTPEAQARVLIDERLRAAGWHVCDRSQIDLVNHVGVAVREVPMMCGHGIVDYLLLVDRRPVGVLEVKKAQSQVVEHIQGEALAPPRCHQSFTPSSNLTQCVESNSSGKSSKMLSPSWEVRQSSRSKCVPRAKMVSTTRHVESYQKTPAVWAARIASFPSSLVPSEMLHVI